MNRYHFGVFAGDPAEADDADVRFAASIEKSLGTPLEPSKLGIWDRVLDKGAHIEPRAALDRFYEGIGAL